MDQVLAIGYGLSLRFIVDAVSNSSLKLTGTLVGLWEGIVLLHFTQKWPKSFDPYVAFGVRLFIDFLVTENVMRMVLVLLWTGIGVVLADIVPSIWDDVGGRRIWSRFKRDMKLVGRDLPTVRFSGLAIPRRRIVRFTRRPPTSDSPAPVATAPAQTPRSVSFIPPAPDSDIDTDIYTESGETPPTSTSTDNQLPESSLSTEQSVPDAAEVDIDDDDDDDASSTTTETPLPDAGTLRDISVEAEEEQPTPRPSPLILRPPSYFNEIDDSAPKTPLPPPDQVPDIPDVDLGDAVEEEDWEKVDEIKDEERAEEEDMPRVETKIDIKGKGKARADEQEEMQEEIPEEPQPEWHSWATSPEYDEHDAEAQPELIIRPTVPHKDFVPQSLAESSKPARTLSDSGWFDNLLNIGRKKTKKGKGNAKSLVSAISSVTAITDAFVPPSGSLPIPESRRRSRSRSPLRRDPSRATISSSAASSSKQQLVNASRDDVNAGAEADTGDRTPPPRFSLIYPDGPVAQSPDAEEAAAAWGELKGDVKETEYGYGYSERYDRTGTGENEQVDDEPVGPEQANLIPSDQNFAHPIEPVPAHVQLDGPPEALPPASAFPFPTPVHLSPTPASSFPTPAPPFPTPAPAFREPTVIFPESDPIISTIDSVPAPILPPPSGIHTSETGPELPRVLSPPSFLPPLPPSEPALLSELPTSPAPIPVPVPTIHSSLDVDPKPNPNPNPNLNLNLNLNLDSDSDSETKRTWADVLRHRKEITELKKSLDKLEKEKEEALKDGKFRTGTLNRSGSGKGSGRGKKKDGSGLQRKPSGAEVALKREEDIENVKEEIAKLEKKADRVAFAAYNPHEEANLNKIDLTGLSVQGAVKKTKGRIQRLMAGSGVADEKKELNESNDVQKEEEKKIGFEEVKNSDLGKVKTATVPTHTNLEIKTPSGIKDRGIKTEILGVLKKLGLETVEFEDDSCTLRVTIPVSGGYEPEPEMEDAGEEGL